jgi:heptosyltransferase-2
MIRIHPKRKHAVQKILVLRFSSLGDLCLLGWSLSRLAQTFGASERQVTLVTKRQFAPLLEMMTGVDEVITLDQPGLGGLWDLSRRLRGRSWDAIYDAHRVLRSRGLLMLMGRTPQGAIAKDTRQRLALLQGAAADQLLGRTMRQRLDEVFGDLLDDASPPAPPPLVHLRPSNDEPPRLGLAPGAQWDTKRWPAEHFAALIADFRARRPDPIVIHLGPREEQWFPGSPLAEACRQWPDIEVVKDRSLPEVASSLARCSAVVTNDSGLLHLAEAVGTPVLALFGPTVRHFGYFPVLDRSEVLEIDLECRPCSRNGKRPCHRGDLACLQELSPDRSQPFLQRMFP